MIRNVISEDVVDICRIYNWYVSQTIISFEETLVSADEMRQRIQDITSQGFPWIVVEQEGNLAGYAYASKWRPRPAYKNTVEATVYLDQKFLGMGLGKNLYTEVLRQLKEAGYHSAMGVIALPNEASVRLHEKMGFEKAAHFKEVGFKFNQWIDVGYWQKML
jgi:phosphinothricin acetyltransferase